MWKHVVLALPALAAFARADGFPRMPADGASERGNFFGLYKLYYIRISRWPHREFVLPSSLSQRLKDEGSSLDSNGALLEIFRLDDLPDFRAEEVREDEYCPNQQALKRSPIFTTTHFELTGSGNATAGTRKSSYKIKLKNDHFLALYLDSMDYLLDHYYNPDWIHRRFTQFWDNIRHSVYLEGRESHHPFEAERFKIPHTGRLFTNAQVLEKGEETFEPDKPFIGDSNYPLQDANRKILGVKKFVERRAKSARTQIDRVRKEKNIQRDPNVETIFN